jgi:hypothetical protein
MQNSRGGPLKLIGALRGDGVLVGGGGKFPVRYKIDLFRRGGVRIAIGEVEGQLSSRLAGGVAGRLKLENGTPLAVAMGDVSADLASFEVEDEGAILCHEAFAKATAS